MWWFFKHPIEVTVLITFVSVIGLAVERMITRPPQERHFRVSHTFSVDSAVFNEDYLASCAVGIVLREFPRPRPRTRRSALAAPERPVSAGRSAARARGPGLNRHRFATAPGARAPQAGRLLRTRRERVQTGPA